MHAALEAGNRAEFAGCRQAVRRRRAFLPVDLCEGAPRIVPQIRWDLGEIDAGRRRGILAGAFSACRKAGAVGAAFDQVDRAGCADVVSEQSKRAVVDGLDAAIAGIEEVLSPGTDGGGTSGGVIDIDVLPVQERGDAADGQGRHGTTERGIDLGAGLSFLMHVLPRALVVGAVAGEADMVGANPVAGMFVVPRRLGKAGGHREQCRGDGRQWLGGSHGSGAPCKDWAARMAASDWIRRTCQ